MDLFSRIYRKTSNGQTKADQRKLFRFQYAEKEKMQAKARRNPVRSIRNFPPSRVLHRWIIIAQGKMIKRGSGPNRTPIAHAKRRPAEKKRRDAPLSSC